MHGGRCCRITPLDHRRLGGCLHHGNVEGRTEAGPDVVEVLKAQAAERLAAKSWADRDLVLATEDGTLVDPRALSRAFAEWATAAGLDDTGTHLGRHFAATAMLSSGRASVADVAAVLGHDPSVLLTTYAAAVSEGQQAAAAALGEVLSKVVE